MNRIRRTYRSLKTAAADMISLVRMALAKGNRIERRTDFSQCERPGLRTSGFGQTRRVLNVLETRLRRAGYCVWSVNQGGLFDTFNTGGIEDLAKLIAEKVDRIVKRHNLPKIDIVAHSMGGLVARYY